MSFLEDGPSQMVIAITKVTLLERSGQADTVWLDTLLPAGVWPYEGTQSLKFEVAQGRGRFYIAVNFPHIEHVFIKG